MIFVYPLVFFLLYAYRLLSLFIIRYTLLYLCLLLWQYNSVPYVTNVLYFLLLFYNGEILFNYHIMLSNNVCVNDLLKAILHLFLILSAYIAFMFVLWNLCCFCLCFWCNAGYRDFCCFVTIVGIYYYLCKHVCNPKIILCHTFLIYNLFLTWSKSIVIADLLLFSFYIFWIKSILSICIHRL